MKTLLLLGAAALTLVHGACPNACSGHGTCDAQDKCTCFLETDGVNDMFKGVCKQDATLCCVRFFVFLLSFFLSLFF